MSILEKIRKLKIKTNENSFDRWYDSNVPKRSTFRPRENKGYGSKRGFSRNSSGEYQFVVTIHDKKAKESTAGSFKVIGKKTSIIKYHEVSTPHLEFEGTTETVGSDKLFFPTNKLKFTKNVSVKYVDPVHYVKTISYWIFIDEAAYDESIIKEK